MKRSSQRHASGKEYRMKGMKQTTNLDDVRLHGGIHTLELATEQISAESTGVKRAPGANRWSINVNKYAREVQGYGEYYISSFTEFRTRFSEMLFDNGVNDYQITRVDFRIDSYETSWREMLKWNYALMYAIRAQIGWTDEVHRWNTYGTSFETFVKDIYTKRKTQSAMSCYDREAIASSQAPTKMRYEIRLREEIPSMVALWKIGDAWADIIRDSANAEVFRQMQQDTTEQALVTMQLEKNELERVGAPVNKKVLLLKARDRLFTQKQAIAFGEHIGLRPATTRQYAKGCVPPLNHEWVTLDSLRQYASMVSGALGLFLET